MNANAQPVLRDEDVQRRGGPSRSPRKEERYGSIAAFPARAARSPRVKVAAPSSRAAALSPAPCQAAWMRSGMVRIDQRCEAAPLLPLDGFDRREHEEHVRRNLKGPLWTGELTGIRSRGVSRPRSP